jgi:ABC-type polysaccharide/polyol phosphate export permease
VSLTATPLARSGTVAEAAKLGAFFRRELLAASHDRLSHVSDWAATAVGIAMFALIGRIVDPSRLPAVNGYHPTYLEFAAVGIVIGAFVQVSMGRVARAIEEEQSRGTLESVLATPTATPTIFLGCVTYDLVYVPLRMVCLFIVLVLAFGLNYHAGGIAPAALYLVAFLPFVWGLGMVSAAITLTFRRGAGVFTIMITTLMLSSGIYFPLAVLPQAASVIAPLNPIWIVSQGMRDSLLGLGWSAVDLKILVLPIVSLVTLSAGLAAIRLSLRREREKGSLALY